MEPAKTPDPKVYHQQLRARLARCNPKEIVARIATDGAGYQDKYGGHGVLVIIPAKGVVARACAASTYTDTDREEFMALLLALRMVVDKMAWTKQDINWHREKPPIVIWGTDRESLALSVARKPDGGTYYGRHSCPDLWASFAYFEGFLDVIPIWDERNTDPGQRVADRLASESRSALKAYYETFLLS